MTCAMSAPQQDRRVSDGSWSRFDARSIDSLPMLRDCSGPSRSAAACYSRVQIVLGRAHRVRRGRRRRRSIPTYRIRPARWEKRVVEPTARRRGCARRGSAACGGLTCGTGRGGRWRSRDLFQPTIQVAVGAESRMIARVVAGVPNGGDDVSGACECFGRVPLPIDRLTIAPSRRTRYNSSKLGTPRNRPLSFASQHERHR
jgi:hypothetical protein